MPLTVLVFAGQLMLAQNVKPHDFLVDGDGKPVRDALDVEILAHRAVAVPQKLVHQPKANVCR